LRLTVQSPQTEVRPTSCTHYPRLFEHPIPAPFDGPSFTTQSFTYETLPVYNTLENLLTRPNRIRQAAHSFRYFRPSSNFTG